jgi:hypothetical protein
MPTIPRLLLLLAGILAPWMAARGQQTGLVGDPWRLVHPQAKWILGVDWGRARNSAGAQILQRQFAGAQTTISSAGMGLGALTLVERIIASGLAVEGVMKESPEGFVVAIEGKIDRSRLKKELPPGTAMEKFRGADLFVPPKAKPDEALLAVVGDGLMLIGDRKVLNLLLSGKGGALDADLAGRAARLATESEIWIAATVPPENQPQRTGNPDPLQGLERVEMGISLRDGLRLTAFLAADTEQSAQNMAGLVQFAGMMGGDDSAASWLRQLRVEQKGKEVELSMDVPAKELERGIEMGRAAVQQAGAQALESFLGGSAGKMPEGVKPAVRGGPGVVALPAAAPEPKVRTIRIVGAEDGPKEIQYTAPGRPGS